MKFIVNSSALLKQLSSINGVITTNPVVPILENFLFESPEFNSLKDKFFITLLNNSRNYKIKLESGKKPHLLKSHIYIPKQKAK